MKTAIIILITVLVINASEYYISFDFSSKNGVLTSYNFNCAKCMTSSYNIPKLLFVLNTNFKTVNDLCNFQQKEIINSLLKYKFHISSYDKKTLNSIYSKTKGVFLPIRFDIIIRDKKAYFYIKEND